MSQFLRSSSIHEILAFFGDLEKTRLQSISRMFYDKIIPSSLQQCFLSLLTKDKFFSYSKEQGDILYYYDIPTRTWIDVKAANHQEHYIYYSMSAVVTDLNRVLLIGGSFDPEFEQYTDAVYDWNQITNRIQPLSNVPFVSFDNGFFYYRGYVYIIEGHVDLFNQSTVRKTARFNVLGNYWQTLPSLNHANGKFNMCAFKNGFIYAFCEQMSSFYRLNSNLLGFERSTNWDLQYIQWERILIKPSVYFGFKMAVFGLNDNQILLFGGDDEFNNQITHSPISKEFSDANALKILDLTDLSLHKIVDDANQDLKIELPDMFYFNQLSEYNGKIYALGKDHIHIINLSKKEIEIIKDDGDYNEEDY
ncbi:kelch motif family protein [Stylonychia lemnae]|uniref:Kelch motif family protein n=1 Tax=Stylonychia lemnae TaxID=5949 RepID=A0A078BB65_STYLE|nr:kelch motif family protein [Stylonychia lemnae]|eukprot:CDW90497.1 kelch motif family protein [Stylonychia lemnae]